MDAPESLNIFSNSMSKSGRSISVRAGRWEFLKINTAKFDLRDTYHHILTLTWPRFAAVVLVVYILINLVFAGLYLLGGRCIAELPPGSFSEAFFFSVETLATVGYGHMYPDTFYGHCVTTVEIVLGMFGMAVITGLIFIRFSRPTAQASIQQMCRHYAFRRSTNVDAAGGQYAPRRDG